MIYRSRSLVTMDGAPVDNGAVVVQGERIAAAGPWPEVRQRFTSEPVTDLGERVVLPGLINAHCHLDYSSLRHAIQPQANFAEWIGRINAVKRTLHADDYLQAIAKGLAESRRWGTTSIFNVESFPELMWKMDPPLLRTWWFYEMIDVRRPIATEELVAGVLLFFARRDRPGWLGGYGLSPHAPYTAKPELYRMARDVARRRGMPLTTHLGESAEERDMFLHARGPLYDFLAGLGRPMSDCGNGRSALAQLTPPARSAANASRCISTTWRRKISPCSRQVVRSGLNIVHCPMSHRYFQHQSFPI